MIQPILLSSDETIQQNAKRLKPVNYQRRWIALFATCFALFMALLDLTIVNVALPTIGTDLNASFSDLQWIVNAYSLTMAVFLITGGRLGDLFGRKRLFIAGMGIFSLGSLFCALSSQLAFDGISAIHILIWARVIQGIGGAMMQPLALAIITATFHGKERNLAIGLYGGSTGLGIALGPILGGLLVEKIHWQAIFYVNIPVGIIGMALSLWAITESRDEHAKRTIDIWGLATLTTGLLCFVLALIQGNDSDKGWTSHYILTLFAISVLSLAAFVIGELRQSQPMVDLRLFKNRSFTGAAVVALSLHSGLFSMLFFLSLYLQNYLGFSAIDAGLRLIAISGMILVSAPIAGILSGRLGASRIMSVGMAIATVAVLLMMRIPVQNTQNEWFILFPSLLLIGLGNGLVSSLIANVAVGTVQRNRAGMASGVSGVCRQLGIAIGIALLGAILTNSYNISIHDKIMGLHLPSVPQAQQHATLTSIVTDLQNAGTFVGSTGLKNIPPQFAQFTHNPLLPQIQHIVQESYISAMTTIFQVAAILLTIGFIASIVAIRKSDMLPADHGNA